MTQLMLTVSALLMIQLLLVLALLVQLAKTVTVELIHQVMIASVHKHQMIQLIQIVSVRSCACALNSTS
jgi:hypothetical protein